jgi:hypothetical protein
MIWLYERGAEILKIETRFERTTSNYELVWHRPDGTHTVEQFANEAAFRVRLEAVEAALTTEEWSRYGPPQILKEGWRT